jgi:glycosyltransferase involved in cell wall biosynthesis
VSSELEVYILSYNRPEYLIRCIQSVLNQTIVGFPIIVLDNASDFDVVSVVSQFENDRISVVANPVNINSFNNFTKAISLSKSKFLTVFHDDDCMAPSLLQEQLNIFNEYPELGFVTTGVNLVYNEDEMLDFSVLKSNRSGFELFNSKCAILDEYFGGKIFGFSTVMYNRSIITSVVPEPQRFAQVIDRAYLLKLSESYSFAYMDSPNCNSFQHIGQDSYNRSWDFMFDLNLIQYYIECSLKFEKKYLIKFILNELALLYCLRHPLPNLRQVFNCINSVSLFEKFSFIIIYLPYNYLRNKLVFFIKNVLPIGFYNTLIKLKKL